MKFRKILTGVLAASLAVTSLSVGAWAAGATEDVTYTTEGGNIKIAKSELDKYTDITVSFTGVKVGTGAGQCGHGINTVGSDDGSYDSSKHPNDTAADSYCNWGGWAVIGDAANTNVASDGAGNKKDSWWQPDSAMKFDGVDATTGAAACTKTVADILASITSDTGWDAAYTLNGIILTSWSGGTISSITSIKGTPKSGDESESSSSTPADDPQDVTVKELFSGSFDTGNWTNNITLAASDLANIQAGDQIIVTISAMDTTQSDIKLQIQDSSWAALPGAGDAGWEGSWGGITVTATGDITYTVQASDVSKLKAGAYVKGANITISRVVLKSTATSDPGSSGSSGSSSKVDPNANYTPPRTETDAPVPETVPDNVSVNEAAIPEGAELEVKAEEVKAEEVKEIVETVKAAAAKISEKVSEVVFNTKVDANLIKDGAKVQPSGKLKIAVKYDGKSNIAVYVDGDKVEFFALTVSADKKTATFETPHLSTFYLATIDAEAAAEVAPAEAPENPDKNQATGVVIAIIPAAIAAAGVIVSKKRK